MTEDYQTDSEAPVFDAGDAATVKDSIKAAQRADAKRQETLIAFMTTPDGRRWFYDLLIVTGVYRNPYSATDRGTAFACGELNVGQRILADIENAAPELYLLMCKENKDG